MKLPRTFACYRGVVRWLATLGLLVFLGIAILISYGEYRNRVAVPFPTDSEVRSSFSRASAWILRNRERILSDDNAMLWLFVREAGRLSANTDLAALAGEYQARHKDGSTWLWQYIFDPSGSELLQGYDLRLTDLPDYNRLFIYGVTCNSSLREDPDVSNLLEPKACGEGLMALRSGWCRTHQLMGLRFVERNRCDAPGDTAETIRRVQNSILAELRWDFRVGDAYIQKVMTLVESGRRRDVKAV